MSTGRGHLFGKGGFVESRRQFKDIFGVGPRKHIRQQGYEKDLYNVNSDPMLTIMEEESEFMKNLNTNIGTNETNNATDSNKDNNDTIINEEKNKDNTMVTAMIGAASQAVQGLTGIASGLIGQRKRNADARAAKRDFQDQMKMFRDIDTSNPFANIQNTYEDLTVNQQAAEFTAEQQQLGMATAMGQMRGAAGSSGIAALAQAMANQQSTNLQKASASIGEQEARNQALAAKGAADRERMLAQGERESRLMEFGKRRDILQISSQRKLAADQASAAGKQALISGVGNLMGGAAAFGASKLLDQG